MTAMFSIDGVLLLLLSCLFITLLQREYGHAGLVLRFALGMAALLAFSCSMHAFGIIPHAIAAAYWARIGLDACLVMALFMRLIYGRFVPHPRLPSARNWQSFSASKKPR